MQTLKWFRCVKTMACGDPLGQKKQFLLLHNENTAVMIDKFLVFPIAQCLHTNISSV